ncbi:YMGG-like glycine zipper-containing protein [Roseateles chitinivorans]|uniref:YMGG-like glycine zipper-containing protein n=1 Tax=Roseateles chitinivorans TaxID=2917965 RepID=UPI003D67A03B
MTASLIRNAALIATCAAMTVGCATSDVKNAGVGAVGGAVVGAVAGGSAVTGAVVGAVAGAVIGRLMVDGKEREVYSDGNGGRYWVDGDGRRHAVR